MFWNVRCFQLYFFNRRLQVYFFSFSFIAFHKKRKALETVLYCTCCLMVPSFINMLSFLFFFFASFLYLLCYNIFDTFVLDASCKLFLFPELFSISYHFKFIFLSGIIFYLNVWLLLLFIFILLILWLLKLFWSLISGVCFLFPTSFWMISLILQRIVLISPASEACLLILCV